MLRGYMQLAATG